MPWRPSCSPSSQSDPTSKTDRLWDMKEEQEVKRGASPDGDRATGLRPQPAAQSSLSSVPSAAHLRGPCAAGHPVTIENTRRIGKAGYRCRMCRSIISAASRRRCVPSPQRAATAGHKRRYQPKKPLVPCPVCGRILAATLAMRVRTHDGPDGFTCLGSGAPASAMSARSDETQSGSVRQDASATAESRDAQTPSGQDQ